MTDEEKFPHYWGWKFERDPCECPCCCPGRGTVEYTFSWSGHDPEHEKGDPGKMIICWYCYFRGCQSDFQDGRKFHDSKDMRALADLGVPYRPWELDGIAEIKEEFSRSWDERIPFNRKISSNCGDWSEFDDHPDGVFNRDMKFSIWTPLSVLDGEDRFIPGGYPVIIGPGSQRCYSVLDQYWHRTIVKRFRQERGRRTREWGIDQYGKPTEEAGGWGKLNMISDLVRMGLWGILEMSGLNDNYPRYLR